MKDHHPEATITNATSKGGSGTLSPMEKGMSTLRRGAGFMGLMALFALGAACTVAAEDVEPDETAAAYKRGRTKCGNGKCGGGETCDTCPQDCGVCSEPSCGDGVCDVDESCSSCELDCGSCGSTCGDGTCDAGETCETCSSDCGTCQPQTYVDDTHQTGSNAPGEVLPGRFDYAAYLANGSVGAGAYDDIDFEDNSLSGQYVLDLVDQHFLVDNNDETAEPNAQNNNSGSGDPDPCEDGPQPTNRYPVTVREPNVAVVGGVIHGYLPGTSPHVGVPQSSDWDHSYCNSSALLFKYAPNGHVDGTRITSAWDGVRVDPDFTIENSWFSHVRDDVVENDSHHSGTFKDSLVDGAFQMFSQRDDAGGGSGNTFTVSGAVLRIAAYPYKVTTTGRAQRFGALLKTDPVAPRVVMKNTVVAIDPDSFAPGSSTDTWASQWDTTWDRIDTSQCSNNVFLWMPSGNHSSLSSALAKVMADLPTQCFAVVETDPAAARAIWHEAKRNWIDCHPLVGRLSADPPSNFNACVADTYGGFTN